MSVVRNGAVTLVPGIIPAKPPIGFWIAGILAKLIIYAVGSLVLWRGRDLAAAYFGTASLLICVAIFPAPSSILSAQAQTVYASIAPCFAELAAFGLYLMVERLSVGLLTGTRLVVVRSLVVAGLAFGFADNILSPMGRIATGCANTLLMTVHPFGYMTALIVTLGVLTAAYVRATGQDRQRLRWIFVSTVIGFSGVLVYLGARVAGHPIGPYPIIDLTATAIPIGYAYAILRHRVIDVGFVLNRAVVFAAMTSLVVASFALLSGVIERAAVGQGTGVALQVSVALALAFSFNALQKRVEAVIDRIFFRERHRTEASLRLLADEAPFVRSADVLLARATKTIRTELDALGVAMYRATAASGYERIEADGSDSPASAPVDDPAFVRMRASLRDVDLSEVESALGTSGVVFPLATQGRVTGALLCADRASGDPYDPDERALVRSLSIRLAEVLETLRAKDLARLVTAIADGSLDPAAAQQRARALIADE
jgi:hypothetical protein